MRKCREKRRRKRRIKWLRKDRRKEVGAKEEATAGEREGIS